MSIRNIRRLPLLEAFHAIHTQGSVVAAADAMGVTQSAVSKQLAQLRDWLGDDLFVRTSDGMQPTPKALEISEHVELILATARHIADDEQQSPSEFDGNFVIHSTDDLLDRMLPHLIDRIQSEAPRMRLITRMLSRDYSVRQLEAGKVNLIVGISWKTPELLVQRRIASDTRVCVMHKRHELATQNLTLKRYADATHVLVAPFGSERGIVDIELEKLGLQRHVCVSVPTFAMVNESTLGHTRIATLPSAVGEALVEKGSFVAKKLPLKVPPHNHFALWHPRFSAEPRMRWVLNQVYDALT